MEMWPREADVEVQQELARAIVGTRDPEARAALEASMWGAERGVIVVRALGAALSDDAARAFTARALAEGGCGASEDAVAELVSVGHALAPALLTLALTRIGCDPEARLARWLGEVERAPSEAMREVAQRHRASRSRSVRVAAQRALGALDASD